MKILILHLSDFHLRLTNNAAAEKIPFITKAIQNEEVELAGVVVVVSGDITYSGKAEEYQVAMAHFAKLRSELKEATKVKDIQFVFVPGNHDCDFSRAGNARETIISAIRKGISAPVDEGMVNLCCDVQNHFFEFRNTLATAGLIQKNGHIYWEYYWEKDGKRVAFHCYNTAWISQMHEQQGGLFFPDKYLGSDVSQITADYSVAIFHHPYNWLPAAGYRTFRGHIEKTSDLILTGHEHEPDHYQKYTFRNEVNEYLEGAVFQEDSHPERSGFHVVFVDLQAQQQRVVSFTWEKDMFLPGQHEAGWTPYKRGGRGGKNEFALNNDFSRWLDDPGASYSHDVKHDALTLSDIFVFPNLREFKIKGENEFAYGSLVEGRDVLKALGAERRVLVFGRQQAGKTTLAKVLFRNFYNKGLTPVILSGDDIKSSHLELSKFETLVELKFQEQFQNPMLPKFQQLDKDKTVLLIDDFDHSGLNARGRLKLLDKIHSRYERVFILGDDVLRLEELASGTESSKVLADYGQFELLQFGHLLRSKLIEQWYSIGSEYVVNPEQQARKIHTAELLITSLLGKNYLPSYPVFILTLLQASDSGNQPNANVGTYGGLYEVLIIRSLAKGSTKVGNLDLKTAYLSEIAYWMFSHQQNRITDANWVQFHTEYCSKFRIKPSRDGLKAEFADCGLIEQIDTTFRFRHPCSFYYFVARYLRDNIAQPDIKDLIESLCSKLNKEEHASIWMFLTHLSKDPFLVDVITKHARKIFTKFTPATLDGDVVFLGTFAKSFEQIVLEDKEFCVIKEARLRQLDSHPPLPADPWENSGNPEEETNETLQVIVDLNLALKTVEVLGQIVKNFPGSLVGTDKFMLVKECYELGLRTISMFFDLFQENSEKFVEYVVDRVIAKRPELAKQESQETVERQLKQFLFWLIENACFGIVKRVSLAVGHSQLSDTYGEVLTAINTNGAALIDISIQLDNIGIPEDALKGLLNKLHSNIFCSRLLQQLVVQHLYLFPTSDPIKQSICAMLDIPIQKLRGLDVKTRQEKQVPRHG